MRANAKYGGKSVPTESQLEALVDASDGLKCRDCKRGMNWFQTDGVGSVCTLQHYRDGSFGLVCRSCNAKHAPWPGDKFCEVPATHKYCPCCEATLPRTAFKVHKRYTTGCYSYCRACEALKRREATVRRQVERGAA